MKCASDTIHAIRIFLFFIFPYSETVNHKFRGFGTFAVSSYSQTENKYIFWLSNNNNKKKKKWTVNRNQIKHTNTTMIYLHAYTWQHTRITQKSRCLCQGRFSDSFFSNVKRVILVFGNKTNCWLNRKQKKQKNTKA